MTRIQCRHCRAQSWAVGGVEGLSMGWRPCHSWMLLSRSLLQQECFFQPVSRGEGDLTSPGPCIRGVAGRGRSCSIALTWSGETTIRNRIWSFGWFLNQMLQAFVILSASSLSHFSLLGSEGPRGRGWSILEIPNDPLKQQPAPPVCSLVSSRWFCFSDENTKVPRHYCSCGPGDTTQRSPWPSDTAERAAHNGSGLPPIVGRAFAKQPKGIWRPIPIELQWDLGIEFPQLVL